MQTSARTAALALDPAPLPTLAMLGNHAPRQCGIATFTTDLSEAITRQFPGTECRVLAMNDVGQRYSYPPQVQFEIAESDPAAYRGAADFLNGGGVDVLSVQHEYGIFGGEAGGHLLGLLRELRVPVVTTLHTILSAPSRTQRAVMDELIRRSDRLVVMSTYGAALLREIHGVPANKIDLIPHGIPSVPPAGRSKQRLGLEGQSVLLTFGLLSPDKGIEHVIDALPAIRARFPQAVYIVLGATHPHVKQQHGEAYRHMLAARAAELGVEQGVIFLDRFVSRDELTEYLSAADIYITPYLKPEQITSGTLAYAVGAGKAVISTPYWYATELLAEGRGVLVPWRDPQAIAQEVIDLLGNDRRRQALCQRAATYGHSMTWPQVARRYMDSFQRARTEHSERRRLSLAPGGPAAQPAPAPPPIDLQHLRLLTDDTGLLQHAVFAVPRYEDGYCLDDNARALLLTTLLEDSGSELVADVPRLTARYLAFVHHAFHKKTRRFRNFMSYSRRFSESCGSEDSHGRAVWALGAVAGRSRHAGQQPLGAQLFHAALPEVLRFTSPRAWAYALLGIDEYLRAFRGDEGVRGVGAALGERLLSLFQRQSQRDWPWFEERATYDNARLCQALLLCGALLDHREMTAVGLRSLAWLVAVQRSEAGDFAPIGSDGWYARGGARAGFDQQPIEACGMISACLQAQRSSGDAQWAQHARRAFRWFLGDNQLGVPLYDAATGGCRDGLHGDRPNENQGAESTLCFLLALLEVRAAQAGALQLLQRTSS